MCTVCVCEVTRSIRSVNRMAGHKAKKEHKPISETLSDSKWAAETWVEGHNKKILIAGLALLLIVAGLITVKILFLGNNSETAQSGPTIPTMDQTCQTVSQELLNTPSVSTTDPRLAQIKTSCSAEEAQKIINNINFQ